MNSAMNWKQAVNKCNPSSLTDLH